MDDAGGKQLDVFSASDAHNDVFVAGGQGFDTLNLFGQRQRTRFFAGSGKDVNHGRVPPGDSSLFGE